mmetsp:Transcript_11604/g.27805  ORF Transcript_11604/g.27805 Transcript_11604/m.27805 type:complete len:86 (-) Transcript_11604:154-411(-)
MATAQAKTCGVPLSSSAFHFGTIAIVDQVQVARQFKAVAEPTQILKRHDFFAGLTHVHPTRDDGLNLVCVHNLPHKSNVQDRDGQ